MKKVLKLAGVAAICTAFVFSANVSEAKTPDGLTISGGQNFELLKSEKKTKKTPEQIRAEKMRESSLGKPDYEVPPPVPKRNPAPSRF